MPPKPTDEELQDLFDDMFVQPESTAEGLKDDGCRTTDGQDSSVQGAALVRKVLL
jgi:hypothetical protein